MNVFSQRCLAFALPLIIVPRISTAQDSGPLWPACHAGQVEVLLLGTYHMANPNLDAVKRDVDDVLAPKRQSEIESLVRRIARFRPNKIAVEAQFSSFDRLAVRYQAYRRGELEPSRNEVVQVGFRLAEQLGHDAVYPVDYRMMLGNDSTSAYWDRHPEVRARLDAEFEKMQEEGREDDRRLLNSTIVEYLRHLNGEEMLRRNHNGMFRMLVASERDNYGGPDMLAKWYSRNLRIVSHLHRITEERDQRIFLLMGSGHVRALRHLLDESPSYCPVSPLSYLQ